MNTSKSFENRICLVTGGTRGIGRAIAKMLLEHGATVAICGRNQRHIDRTISEFQAESLNKVKGKAADVKNYASVRELFEFIDREWGRLDVLVNNAGIGKFAKISELTNEDWDAVVGTNLTGAFYCTREALSRFQKSGSGYVINISSLAGKNAFAGGAAYNASKFGINGFAEAVMLDVRYDNVRVTNIMPGSVATEFGGSTNGGRNWKVWPEDIAQIVQLLLQMPERTMVSQVEVRPSKPNRS